MKTVLIVCRDISSYNQFLKLKLNEDTEYIVLSNDIRIHKQVKKLTFIKETTFIDKAESFYIVAEDVIKLLSNINNWMKSLVGAKLSLPSNLLFWMKHREGGLTTKRIEDLIFLIRSYKSIIEKHKPDSIIIINKPGYHWEDNVLIKVAKGRGINFVIKGKYSLSVLIYKLKDYLKPFAIEAYYLLVFIRAKTKSVLFNNLKKNNDKEIVIQVCSSAPKHLSQIIPLLKEIEAKGYKAVALCWGTFRAAKRFRNENLGAVDLEGFAPWSVIISSYFLVLIMWLKAIYHWESKSNKDKYCYEGIDLKDMLRVSHHSFIISELPYRIRLSAASQKYFTFHSPLAINFWTLIFPEAVIPYKYLDHKKSVIFHWASPLNHARDNPYEHHIIEPDLIFTSSPKQSSQLSNLDFDDNKMICVGQLYNDNIKSFKINYNKKASLNILSIPDIYNKYIMFDPGFIMRGVMSPIEQIETTELLLAFIEKHKDVALLIKPHPSYNSGMLDAQVDYFNLPNVFLLQHKMLPHHALNVSDLLITKFSLIGVEGMHFEVPIISLILDNEERFKLFDKAAEYIFSLADLEELMEKLLNDTIFFESWQRKRLLLNEIYLKENIYSSSESSYKLVVNALDNRLKNNKT